METHIQISHISKREKKHVTKYLNKLHTYSITTITWIQNLSTQQILSPQGFKIKYKA